MVLRSFQSFFLCLESWTVLLPRSTFTGGDVSIPSSHHASGARMLSDLMSQFAGGFSVWKSGLRFGARGRRSLAGQMQRIEPAESRCLLSGVAPVLVSMTPSSPPPALNQFEFEVRFSEPVSGVNTQNFSVINGFNSYVDSVSGGPELWKVRITGLGYYGTVGLRFEDPNSVIRDVDGNPVYSTSGQNRVLMRDEVSLSGMPGRESVVFGDFDGDSLQDVARLISSRQVRKDAVEFLFGQQDGTFRTGGAAVAGDGNAWWIRRAKFDSDGYPDVAVGFAGWTGVAGWTEEIQLVDVGPSGSTVGSSLITLQSTESLNSVFFEDLNGDGLSEIITLAYLPPLDGQSRFAVRVRWNDGSGGYSEVTESAALNGDSYYAYFKGEAAVRFVNVTGDARPEILLLPPLDQSLRVLAVQQSSGANGLPIVASYPLGDPGLQAFAQIADLTGDGVVDLVYGSYDPGTATDFENLCSFHVLNGLPAGLFGESRPLTDLTGNPLVVGCEPAAAGFRVSDVNQDGLADVFCVSQRLVIDPASGDGSDTVDLRWLQAHANGRFSSILLDSVEKSQIDGARPWMWGRPASAAAGQGLDVLLFYGFNSDNLIARVKFAAQPSVQTEIRQSTLLSAVQYGDFNGDGISEELLWGVKDRTYLRNGIWVGEYEQLLEFSGRAPRTVDSGNASAIAFGRISGVAGASVDSRLVVAESGMSTVRLYQGSGQGLPTGLLNRQVTAEYAVNGPPVDLVVSDLDGNGTLDLATANSTASGAVSILLGSGSTLNPAAGIDLPSGSSALTVADLNNDGVGDLLVAGMDGNVRLLRGNGNGSFQPAMTVFQSSLISALHVADISGDGIPDLIVEHQSSGSLTFVQGTGAGAFILRGNIQSGGGVQVSRMADVNRDGLADVVVGTAAGSIRVYQGKSAGVLDPSSLLTTQLNLPETAPVQDLQVADLTGDDRPEIAVLQVSQNDGFSGSLIAVFAAPALPNSQWELWSEKRGEFQHLFVEELGKDGRPDLLLASRSGRDYAWYQNDHLPYESSLLAPYNTNAYPTLNVIAPVQMLEDAAELSIPLTGITAGGFEVQSLRVTAVSSQTTVLGTPQVIFSGNSTTGQLLLKPVPFAAGVVQVTVTVDDGGFDSDFNTLDDNRSFSRTFDVTIVPQRPRVTVPPAPIKAPLTVNWTAVPNAASYRVFIRNYSLGQNPIVLAETTQTSWTSATDLAMGRCEVWVQAVLANAKRLPWSLGQRFTVMTPPVSDAIPPRLADPMHEFSWTAVPGATEYRVWVTFVSGGANPLVQQKVTGLKWRPSEPLPVGRHTFWVQAIAPDATTSSWSGPVNFLVSTPPRQLSPLASVFDTTPLFQWESVAGAASYGVSLQSVQTGAVVANVSGVKGLSWEPTLALPNGDYRWWVIAETTFNGLRGNWSPAVTFYVGGRAEIIQPLPGTVTSPLPVISWKRIDDAVSYRVWITQISPLNRVVVNVSGVTSTTYQVSQLLSAGGFRVWVQAVTAGAAAGPWSLPVNFTVPLLTAVDPVPATLGVDLHALGRDTARTTPRVSPSHAVALAPVTVSAPTTFRSQDLATPGSSSEQEFTMDEWQQMLDQLLLDVAT
ncbi:MAG TPA: hypothetical protein DC058_21485 [Planctomycetaceae bacterium]|nr:hypothetical protein [Planctomycetaceae bacterium]HBC63772.1 hypothetical protein [Planctomycetaceae bacterium]